MAEECCLVRALFLRLLGLVYGIAFASLWVQVDGLIGSQGILPAQEYLDLAAQQLGNQAWTQLPTLCWFAAGDSALNTLCATGVLLSLCLVIGLAPLVCSLALWALYLSLFSVAQVFLSYQWDILLLETGFLAILWAPLSLRPAVLWSATVSRPILWLLRWLLFRLIFSSGVVKLLSGDPAWRSLQALGFHYESQPLPTWTSWYVHQLPAFVHSAATAVALGVELVVPFAIFAPRRIRLIGAAALAALQLVIAATGNYGFFNLLTLVLCLVLLDDAALSRLPSVRRLTIAAPGRGMPRWLVLGAGALIVCLSTFDLSRTLRISAAWPKPIVDLYRSLSPLQLTSGYGLFAVMTTTRPEIEVEGSEDGATWKAYAFRWKAGASDRAPAFCAPHMPRLDWQMWFAALGSFESNRSRWFSHFMARLLEGSPAVLNLLAENPFEERPPRFVRARLYRYTFTGLDERRSSGDWWRRELTGPYSPVLSLRAAGR